MDKLQCEAYTPKAAEELTTMFECSDKISAEVKERFEQLFNQRKNEIASNTQHQLADVLGNEEKCEVVFNQEAVTNESQLGHYFRNQQSVQWLNNQLKDYFA